MPTDDVKPYTDEELRDNFPWPDEYRRDYSASMANGGSRGAACATDRVRITWLDRATHRLLATIQEDRRKLAIAEKALQEITSHADHHQQDAACYNEARRLAQGALREITSTSTPDAV